MQNISFIAVLSMQLYVFSWCMQDFYAKQYHAQWADTRKPSYKTADSGIRQTCRPTSVWVPDPEEFTGN